MLMKLCGLRLCLVTRKFLHSSLSMNFCIPHCPLIFDIVALLIGRCISSLYEMMMLNFVI
jgi:hypothetical protein